MPQSLFTSQTPVVTDASDGAPGITRAVSLQFSEPGQITHVRWWCSVAASGVQTVAVWEMTSGSTGTLKQSKVHSGTPTGGAWNTTLLDSPIVINPAKGYRVAIHNAEGRYVATSGFFSGSALTNGSITAPANGSPVGDITSTAQGTFDINATIQFPTTTFNQTNYFADVVFVPDSEGGGVSGSGVLTFGPLQLAADGTPDPDLSGTLTLPGLDLSGTAVAEQDVLPQDGAAYEKIGRAHV